MKFRDYVYYKRSKLCLTQEQCAELMRINRVAFNRLELGNAEWTISKMEAFANKVLQVTLLEMFLEIEEIQK